MVAPDSAVRSVLLVDDDPAILRALQRTLRGLPVKIRTACSGEEGLALVEAEVPRLVMSDFLLPGMDGLRFLEEVKHRHPSVACVLHTGAAIPFRFGVDVPVLEKPCESEVLVQLVWSIIEVSPEAKS